MRSEHILNKPAILLAGLFLSFTVTTSFSQTHKPMRGAGHATPAPSGEQVFASNCVGCHGLDGTGSQRAPNIISNPQVQKLSVKEMTRIVSEGVPGTGMPAFKRLGQPAIKATVAYVRGLQGNRASTALPGDPKRGEIIFFGDGQCANCHMAGGRGGFIGPDLSAYSQTHSADAIRSAIINPSASGRNAGLVTAMTAMGERFEGIVRNEDNFSLQLQSTDGAFHFLSKAEIKTIERSQTPLMPSDYASRLTAAQLNDVVSYVLKIAQSAAPPESRHAEEE
jgi:putative heme-binding domain-containing protein